MLATERYCNNYYYYYCHVISINRLLTTEEAGGVCRDDSVEGLRFYPNKFLD